MATRTWGGGTSTAADLAANWSGSVVPGNGDTVIIPLTATRDMLTNMGGLADTIKNWIVVPGSTVQVGASGAILTVSIENLIFYGAKPLWFADDAGITTNVTIGAHSASTIVHLGGDTIVNIFALRGNITLDGTIGTVTRLQIGMVGNVGNDVTLTGNAGGTLAAVHQYGGKADIGNTVTAYYLHAGKLTKTSTTSVVTLEQRGGTCLYNSTGTITVAYVSGGVFDLTQSTGQKTITDAWWFPGSTIHILEEGDTVKLHTITTPHDLRMVA